VLKKFRKAYIICPDFSIKSNAEKMILTPQGGISMLYIANMPSPSKI
jgi:hypothetical protein